MCAVALRQSRSEVSRIAGARKAAIAGYVIPCDSTLRETPRGGEGWVYEIKAETTEASDPQVAALHQANLAQKAFGSTRSFRPKSSTVRNRPKERSATRSSTAFGRISNGRLRSFLARGGEAAQQPAPPSRPNSIVRLWNSLRRIGATAPRSTPRRHNLTTIGRERKAARHPLMTIDFPLTRRTVSESHHAVRPLLGRRRNSDHQWDLRPACLLSGPLRGLLNPSGREKSSLGRSRPEALGGAFVAMICGRECRCAPSLAVLGERLFSRMPANRLLAQDSILAKNAYVGQPFIFATCNRLQAAVCFRAASLLRNSSSHCSSFGESGSSEGRQAGLPSSGS